LNEQIPISPTTTTGTFTPNHFYRSEYAVMKTNGRFVAEAVYLYRNLGFRLRYQQSFTPNYQFSDFDGQRFTKKLAIFTVGFSCRIQ
jgi:hypothetical protein